MKIIRVEKSHLLRVALIIKTDFVQTVLMLCLAALCFIGPESVLAQTGIHKSPATMLGGGNFHGDVALLQALNTMGAGICRIPVNPGMPNSSMDNNMLQAYQHDVEPMLLIEYYTNMGGIGSYQTWYDRGRAYAERYQPGSDWLVSQGVNPNWGITYYSAINEPMWTDNNPGGIPVDGYAAAIEGFADGVHSINAALMVSPGGFQEIPLLNNNPFGPAIAHLWNEGKLQGIDIHRYWDIEWQPMYGTFQNSLQNQFSQVKEKWGITADIDFYTTEFNFKKRLVDEYEAADGFLTAIWDALGVVGNKGQHVSQFALPWNLFNSPNSDNHYGMGLSMSPWRGTARGLVVQMVCALTTGMQFVELDPMGKGEYVLNGSGKKAWVWQNRDGWTDHPGTVYNLEGIPHSATKIDVYTWNGLFRSLDISNISSLEITGLAAEQTYIFMANAEGQALSLTPPGQSPISIGEFTTSKALLSITGWNNSNPFKGIYRLDGSLLMSPYQAPGIIYFRP